MLDLVGSNANGDFVVNTINRNNVNYSNRLLRYYGNFNGALLQIGYKGRDNLGHFEDTLYDQDGAKQVVVGRGATLMIRVSNATPSTDIKVDELFI